MEHIVEFGDERQKTWCVHCTGPVEPAGTRDHVPTRALLDKPYPANLPVVRVCDECNRGFSRDEQYFVALLGCMMSGTAEADKQLDLRIARMLRENPGLRKRIASSRRAALSVCGEPLVAWVCETQRIEHVIVKNARGHLLFEYNEPMMSAPSRVWFAAMGTMSDSERREFEEVADPFVHQVDQFEPDGRIVLPEVGSRSMTRALTGLDTVDGWIEVQQGVYRYAVEQLDSVMRVRSVLREQLATEVAWDSDGPCQPPVADFRVPDDLQLSFELDNDARGSC